MTEQKTPTIRTFLVAVQSNFVEEAKVLCGGSGFETSIQNASLVLGTTFEQDECGAIEKMSVNHNIPKNLLTAYQLDVG